MPSRRWTNFPWPRWLTALLMLCFTYSSSFWPAELHSLFKRSDIPARLRSVFAEQTNFSGTSNATLLARTDPTYSCSGDNPCSNGACCGSAGYCGYGPTYCGTGCQSNCNSQAECGQYAPKGQAICPLNVCCSKYGFCGTTTDFCDTGCQSNCILNPAPPAGASGVDVRSKVVGYYESWAATRGCHSFQPSQLPLDGLTHINYAFAYIDPSSLEIVTMDTSTPASSFQAAADAKTFKTGNADLKVFVSVGGWTFGDNGTATQPVFGDIAADAGKRATFASNVVRFLDQYGFDGLDVDWEYPGAPDRGGSKADTENYVLMMEALRSAFDASPRQPGLTFTAPTSYWYLRWFDVPGLLKYADWINFMAYDLHGVWDQDDPIGSIVQGHTNLTEIKLAVELLWRVNVPPSKVVLGTGFYGRSFKLQDPSCTAPGCPFSGAGAPGSCTQTAGILGYFEIADILNQKTVTPVHDATDAVMYVVWDKDNWVSYDNSITFQQKVSWANGLGLGGLMIWANDLDDDHFTALSGLLDRSVGDLNLTGDAKAVAQDWAGQNGQQCVRFSECVDLDNPQAASCGTGYVSVGYDDAGCGRKNHHYGKPICCPATAYPRSCTWRGNGGDCNGQCHAGEITLFGSSWGGDPHPPGDNTDRCGRGGKVFCCVADQWANLINACSWSACGVQGASCSSGTQSVAEKYDYQGCANCYLDPRSGNYICEGPYYRQFCCPIPVQFENCHWVGQGDCAQNQCSPTDVTIATDAYGDSRSPCNWGRQKTCCCNAPANQPDFLPVPLSDIFPTLPPANDIPKYDLQFPHGGSSASPNNNAFGFVLVDGAPGAVSSTKHKRDGTPSALQFLGCEDLQSTMDRQTLRFVCTSNEAGSDCDDMMEDGLPGTIVEMPCGAGKYAVAHAVVDAEDQSLPAEFEVLQNKTVKVLSFDYRFDLAKRDSGDIYFRADYSNIAGYWNTFVDAPANKKRSADSKLETRFWDATPSNWGQRWRDIDVLQAGKGSVFSADLSAKLVSIVTPCSGKDAFAEILSSGTASGSSRMGISMVGTISPDLNIQEVNAFMNTELDLNVNFDFALYGQFGLDFTTQPLLSDPVVVDDFNHIGLFSIDPTLEVDAHLSANQQSNIAANFSSGVHGYTSSSILQSFPGSALSSQGQTSQQTVQNTFSGEVFDASGGSIKVEIQPKLGMQISLNQYGTSGTVLNAFIEGSLDSYNALNINNDKTFNLQMGTGAASGELTYTNSVQEFTPWSSDNQQSRVIGSAKPASVLYSGRVGGGPHGTLPNPHYIENDGDAVFNDLAHFLTCPTGLSTGKNITCDFNLCSVPGFCDDDDDEDTDGPLSRRAIPRALIERGKARDYTVDLGNGQTVVVTSRSYPSRGVLFDGANGRQVLYAAFGLINDDCTMTGVLDESPDDVDINDFVTEHIIELQTIARFIQAAVTGQLPSGATVTGGLVSASFFVSTWNAPNTLIGLPNIGQGISPTNLNDRVSEAMGSYTNRQDFVLCNDAINAIKAKFWSQINPISVDDFQDLVTDAITNGGDPAEFLEYIRRGLGFFSYISDNDVVTRLRQTNSDVLGVYQEAATRLQGATNLPNVWNQFIPDYLETIGAYARTWLADRILDVRNLYGRAQNAPNAQQVLAYMDAYSNDLSEAQMPTP